MASISLLPSPTQSSLLPPEISTPPSYVKFRRSSFSTPTAAAATAAFAGTESESATASFTSRFKWPPKPASPSQPASFYDVLGIPIGATREEIRAAYRRRARACHPDVAGKESSASEFMEIHTAYSTLLDPEKRGVYDRRLFREWRGAEMRAGVCGCRNPAKSSRFASSAFRNWETDQCW
ncbi:unnamed protein product [Cuscuta campestris]|uniref:J domain-containing protein n=1 Tax=Cuscuta campestris TaxID=132261 RepID=A0A484LGB7_9ASTE|nr:unnamed protein product [Cuscuta campestris]